MRPPSRYGFRRLLSFLPLVVWTGVSSFPLEPPAASALREQLSAADCRQRRYALDGENVAVIEQRPADGQGVAVRVCGQVDAPPARVWAVLRDCGKFEQFLPRVSRSRLRSRNDNVVVCDETIDLPFPLSDLHSISRVVESILPGGGFARHWSLIRGTYRRMEGAWVVLPWDEAAERTLLVYEVDMDPDTVIPDRFVQRAQVSAAPDVFQAVRERVRQCADGAPSSACGGE